MKKKILLLLMASVSTDFAMAASCFVTAYFVPPPGHRNLQVVVECVDSDNPGNRLGLHPKDVRGRTYFRELINVGSATKRVTVKFGPNLPGFQILPDEVTLDLSPIIDVRTVTWIALEKSRDEVYLQNVTEAGRLLKEEKKPDEAADHAAYATAVAGTANQKIEAAKLEAEAHTSKQDYKEALAAFSNAAEAPNFTRADRRKKKAFVAEWFDTIEKTAKSESGKTTSADLVLPSVSPGSQLPKEFQKLTQTLNKVEPNYSAKAAKLVPQQSEKLGSELAAQENVVRKELDRNPVKLH